MSPDAAQSTGGTGRRPVPPGSISASGRDVARWRTPRLGLVSSSIAFVLLVVSARALEVVRLPEPQQVFADGLRAVEVRFRNSAPEAARIEVRIQLLQLSSATVAPVGGPRAWKRLTVLPGQTILETAEIEFPKLRTPARFAARWLDADGKLLGVTEVWAHPENLLAAFKLLAGGQAVGLSGETGALRPVLTAHGIVVSELSGAKSWDDFRGRLALFVSKPGSSQDEFRTDAAVLSRAKEGLAVVWLQTPRAIPPSVPPLVERMQVGRGGVVLAPESLLAGLDRSPAAQLALMRLAELALSPPSSLLASIP